MGKNIKLSNTSGSRIAKKPKLNQTELISDGYDLNLQTDIILTPVGSQNPFETDTWNHWNTKKNAGQLPIATYVCISDAGYTDLGAILLTNTEGTGFSVEGVGYFLNADFQSNGNYSGINPFISQFGVWSTTLESNDSFQINGAVTIWNCIHYVVINPTAFNGSSPDGNSSAYSALTKSVTNGYILENDSVIFNFNNNQVNWRKDKRGNYINNYSLQSFQFGDDKVFSYIITNENSYCSNYNNTGYITGNQNGDDSEAYIENNAGYIQINMNGFYPYIYAPNNTNSGQLYINMVGFYQGVYTPGNSGQIEAHIHGFSSGLESNNNTGDIKSYIYDTSYIIADANSGDLYNRYYDNAQVYHENNAGDINFCEFKNTVNLQLSLNGSSSHYSNVYSNASANSYGSQLQFPNNVSYSNCVLTQTESTFSGTIDITGRNTFSIDDAFEGYSGGFLGEITLTSSNSAETISSISLIKDFGFPVKVVPNAGLNLTIDFTPISAATTGQIIYAGVPGTNPVTSVTLVGRSQIELSDSIYFTAYQDGSANIPKVVNIKIAQ